MTFAQPLLLWCLAGLPLVWGGAWISRRGHTARRLALATVLRSLVLGLLVLAAAQPRLPGRSDALSVVYAIDVSRSVSPASVARTLDWIRAVGARHPAAQARYVVFADRARMVTSLDALADLDVARTGRGDGDALVQTATDVEQALRTAVGGFGVHGARRLVLVSDGRQTRGDLWRMLPRLQAAQVRVFTLPAEPALARDAWVEAVSVPPGPRQHEPVGVRVRVGASTAMAASVDLSASGRRLGRMATRLLAGDNEIVFTVALPEAGPATIGARVRAEGDEFSGNDAQVEAIVVAQPPRVLYAEGVPESARHLADALRAQHLDVTVVGAEGLPAQARVLDGYDGVILSDLFVQSLDAATAGALEIFVRERGGALVFVAGESTYGQEGFAGSPVERMLPVRFEGRRKRRDLDLVLLIDRSHSMRGRKLELAKTAALSTLDLLEPRHRLAVVAFDSRPHPVVPLAAVGNKRRAEDLISSMTARGQTSIHPALVEARRLLQGSTATTKHVILLSDGITAQPPGSAGGIPNAAEIQALIMRGREEAMRRDGIPVPKPDPAEPVVPPGAIEALVAELAADKVTVSTVAIGDKPNLELMADIAALGHGRAHVARDDAEIPGLFVAETRRLLGESMVEESFRPSVAHRVPALAGIDFAAGPPLRGMVVARAKQFADVSLQGPKARPLLATTHYGLGKTVAFLSDAKNRWSADWLGWDGYGRFWAQVLRDAMPRRVADEGLMLRVRREGGEAAIELRALDGGRQFRNGLAPVVDVRDPAGRTAPLALIQTAPGQYGATLRMEAGQGAPYRIALVAGGGITGAEARAVPERAIRYGWPEELRGLPPDLDILRALAEATGGAFAPTADDIFALRGDGTSVPRPLWPPLVGAALLLFLLDILVRRAPLPRRWRATA